MRDRRRHLHDGRALAHAGHEPDDPARLEDLSGRITAFRLACCFERLKRAGRFEDVVIDDPFDPDGAVAVKLTGWPAYSRKNWAVTTGVVSASPVAAASRWSLVYGPLGTRNWTRPARPSAAVLVVSHATLAGRGRHPPHAAGAAGTARQDGPSTDRGGVSPRGRGFG